MYIKHNKLRNAQSVNNIQNIYSITLVSIVFIQFTAKIRQYSPTVRSCGFINYKMQFTKLGQKHEESLKPLYVHKHNVIVRMTDSIKGFLPRQGAMKALSLDFMCLCRNESTL